MDMRARLRKAAGLFVQLPPEESEETSSVGHTAPPTRTIDQLVRDSEGPNLEDIGFNPSPETPLFEHNGSVDFAKIYEQAGLPIATFTAEQMVDMLHSLPNELPLAMKRQTVNVALNAMGKSLGATPETVVSDASRKLAALTAYTDSLAKQTAQTVADAEQEIAALQARIAEQHQVVLQAQAQLAAANQLCHAESDRLDDVLEFFSLDVPPSRLSKPELPTA